MTTTRPCCKQLVAVGRFRSGIKLTVTLHGPTCPQPLERRRPLTRRERPTR